MNLHVIWFKLGCFDEVGFYPEVLIIWLDRIENVIWTKYHVFYTETTFNLYVHYRECHNIVKGGMLRCFKLLNKCSCR